MNGKVSVAFLAFDCTILCLCRLFAASAGAELLMFVDLD